MHSKSKNNFCKTSVFGGFSRVIRKATDNQLGLMISIAPNNNGLVLDHEWVALQAAQISFFRTNPEMFNEIPVGVWEQIQMKMGAQLAEFLVHGDILGLIDEKKLKEFFDINTTNMVMGKPFILLAKDPSVHTEQLRYWRGYVKRTPECRHHFQEIFDNLTSVNAGTKPTTTVPLDWLIDYAALLRKEGESVRLNEVTTSIISWGHLNG